MKNKDLIRLFSDYMQVVGVPRLSFEQSDDPALQNRKLGVINGSSWVSLWSSWFGKKHLKGAKVVNVGNEAVQLNFMGAHKRGEDVPPQINIDRFCSYARDLYELYDVDAIMISCSTMNRAYGKVAGTMAPFGVPVIQIDQEMMERAVSQGGRILIIATHGPTVKSTQALLEETAEVLGKKVSFVGSTIEDAFELLGEGKVEEHNEKIAAAIRDVQSREKIDVVVLAQLSMSVFGFSYPDPVAEFGVPVLNSGDTGFERAAKVLASLPPKKRTVIVDDDPTGCQTVRDVPVMMSWNVHELRQALEDNKSFFILTNTRAMSAQEAAAVSAEVAANLKEAAGDRYDIRLISRSDSTLRGHLVEEVTPFAGTFGLDDGIVLCPAFFEAGRVTADDTHYTVSDDGLIPVSDSESAKDPVFGYSTSHLPSWIEETSGGRIPAGRCVSVRPDGSEDEVLLNAPKGSVFIVNAMSYEQLERIQEAVVRAEKAGKRYLFRTAASYVRTALRQEDAPFYQPVPVSGKKGLVVVGSYTERTTSQLKTLLSLPEIAGFEINVSRILGKDAEAYMDELAVQIDERLKERNCVVYTSRSFVGQPEAGNEIADFVCRLCARLNTAPDFIVAKGGITSLTLARESLGVRSAKVAGQIEKGVPVWILGQESRFPGMEYVVFPGNVGTEETLLDVYKRIIC